MPEMMNPASVSDLIYWVKKELLSEEARKKDPVPLFSIEEVTVEVNFVVDTNVKAGVSILKVVDFGSEIGGQAVQKATIKMKPLVKSEELLEELSQEEKDKIRKSAIVGLFKGTLKGGEVKSPR